MAFRYPFVSGLARGTAHSLHLIASQQEASEESTAMWKVLLGARPKESSQQAISGNESASALPNMLPTRMFLFTDGTWWRSATISYHSSLEWANTGPQHQHKSWKTFTGPLKSQFSSFCIILYIDFSSWQQPSSRTSSLTKPCWRTERENLQIYRTARCELEPRSSNQTISYIPSHTLISQQTTKKSHYIPSQDASWMCPLLLSSLPKSA